MKQIIKTKPSPVYDEKRENKRVIYSIPNGLADKLDQIMALEAPQHDLKARNDLIHNFITFYRRVLFRG